jgi:hypothetical protein
LHNADYPQTSRNEPPEIGHEFCGAAQSSPAPPVTVRAMPSTEGAGRAWVRWSADYRTTATNATAFGDPNPVESS